MSLTVDTITKWLCDQAGVVPGTVDTLKAGRPDKPVRKVAVVFTATYAILERAIAEGADLIVTHEPTYYNHRDETDWLSDDPVLRRKRELIERSGVAIFRLHDYIHRYEPDGILAGMLQTLDWARYADPSDLHLLAIPEEERQTVRTIAEHLKKKLGVDSVAVAGNPEQPVRRIGLMPGAPGGQQQIAFLSQAGLDLLVTGETHEWETNEFVRDAADMGYGKALIIVGHQKSEEAGMRIAAEMLRGAFPELEIALLEGVPALRRL